METQNETGSVDNTARRKVEQAIANYEIAKNLCDKKDLHGQRIATVTFNRAILQIANQEGFSATIAALDAATAAACNLRESKETLVAGS